MMPPIKVVVKLSRLGAFMGAAWVGLASVSLHAQSSWTLRDSGTTANLWAVTDGGSKRLVAVGEQGTIVTSTDGGASWSRQQSGTTAWLTAVTYSSQLDRFFAVGEGGTILTSSDAIVWQREASPTAIRLNSVADSGDGSSMYAIGESGAGLLQRDKSGVWARYDVGFGERWLRGLLLSSSGRVTVGQGGVVLTPADGLPFTAGVWQPTIVPTTSDLESVTRGAMPGGPMMLGQSYLAVGANGTIIQSTNEGWSLRNSGTTERLRGVSWITGANLTLITLTVHVTIGEYFAVGTNGTILRSSDGVAWVTDTVPTRKNLNGVYGALVVGDSGTILQMGGPGAAPVITAQPTTGLDANGEIYAQATASGSGALTYLWLQTSGGGVLYPVGYAGPQQSLARAPFGRFVWAFQLYVINAFGLVASTPFVPNRFLDLSGRAVVGAGDNTLIGGFSITGTGSRTVLIRAVGPTLADFGVSNALAAPRLSVFSDDKLIAANSGWSVNADSPSLASAAHAVGAFPLPAGSADSALLLTLDPGNYTAQVVSADGSTGTALVEVYDTSAPARSHLKNLSTRAQVQSGAGVLIGGLVIEGGVKKSVLLRAAGPALGAFGVGSLLSKPKLTLFRGGSIVATATAWGAEANAAAISAKATVIGAFSFPAGSADSAMLLDLDPGAYTLQVSGADGGTGVALVEVYEVPQP